MYVQLLERPIHMNKNKIQSLNVKESYFQKKRNLATTEVLVKVGFGGAGGKVLDLEQSDATKRYIHGIRGNNRKDCNAFYNPAYFI